MATSNTRFTQNSLGQSKNPIDSDHGIYRASLRDLPVLTQLGHSALQRHSAKIELLRGLR